MIQIVMTPGSVITTVINIVGDKHGNAHVEESRPDDDNGDNTCDETRLGDNNGDTNYDKPRLGDNNGNAHLAW